LCGLAMIMHNCVSVLLLLLWLLALSEFSYDFWCCCCYRMYCGRAVVTVVVVAIVVGVSATACVFHDAVALLMLLCLHVVLLSYLRAC
jgi:hypothetical protein